MKVKDIDKPVVAEWLALLWSIRSKAGSIISNMARVEETGSQPQVLTALAETVTQLTPILVSMKEIPPKLEGIDMRNLRTIQVLEVKALENYIAYCKLNIQQIQSPGRVRGSTMARNMSLACSYWDISAKETARLLHQCGQQ